MCDVFTRRGFGRPPCVSCFVVTDEFRTLEEGRSPLLERSRCLRETERPRGGVSYFYTYMLNVYASALLICNA